MPEALGREDYTSVTNALHAVGRSSLNDLLMEWQGLVECVEEGYAWTAYEYDNELTCRKALATAWPLLTERIQRLRQSELDALDARFRAATVPKTGSDRDTAEWWTSRTPRHADDVQ